MDVTEYFQDSQYIFEDGFSPPVVALLSFADADNYISLFKDHNIGFKDLSELTDIDLITLGVDSEEIRDNIVKAIKQLPESAQYLKAEDVSDFTTADYINIVDDNSKQLERICTSILSTKVLFRKQIPDDYILRKPKTYASEIVLKSIYDMEESLNDMTKHLLILKMLTNSPKKSKFPFKKVIIGSVGSLFVVALSYSLFKSIQNIHIN